MKRSYLSFLLIALVISGVFAQTNVSQPETDERQAIGETDSSFGFGNEHTDDTSSHFALNLNGTISTGGGVFFTGKESFFLFPTIVWGTFSVNASAPFAQAEVTVRLDDTSLPLPFRTYPKTLPRKAQIPPFLEKAVLSLIVKNITFSAGIQTVAWSRSDFLSILDVVNPRDFTDYTHFDTEAQKIPRPLFLFTAYLPKDVRLDAVFLPLFEANRYALSGRWKNQLIDNLFTFPSISPEQQQSLQQEVLTHTNTADIRYAQGGARLSASVQGHDLGFEYFFGRKREPSIELLNSPMQMRMHYNPYHLLGLDWGTSFGPVSVTTELATEITHDTSGTNPLVYNPKLMWNVGFSYAIPINLTLSAGIRQDIRLFNSRIKDKADVEFGKPTTNTVLLLSAEQRLLRDALSLCLKSYITIERPSAFIESQLTLLLGSVSIDGSIGFFMGKANTLFGQFSQNHFIKLSLSYAF